jgi:hypothetical protein
MTHIRRYTQSNAIDTTYSTGGPNFESVESIIAPHAQRDMQDGKVKLAQMHINSLPSMPSVSAHLRKGSNVRKG